MTFVYVGSEEDNAVEVNNEFTVACYALVGP